MEAKKKNVSVYFMQSRKVPDAAVVLSIKFNAGGLCLTGLKGNKPCAVACKGCCHAALCYAVYECARDKVMGSPLELSRSRVSNIKCNSIGNDFVLSWNTAPTLSAIRKSLVLAASCLVPGKLYAKYADNAKLMGVKPDRAEFNKLADDMGKAIKKSVSIAVIGKGKLTKEKVQALASKVADKLPSQKSDSPKKGLSVKGEHKTEYPCWVAKGLGAALAVEYIQAKSNGMNVELAGDKICVYSKSWESKKKALKSRVGDYVNQKFKKLGVHLGGVLAYLIATQCHGSADIVKAASKMKVGEAAAKIKGSF